MLDFLTNSRHSTDREVSIMILMAYLSYMLAEVRFLQLVAMQALSIQQILPSPAMIDP